MAIPDPHDVLLSNKKMRREQLVQRYQQSSSKLKRTIGSLLGWYLPEITGAQAFFGLSGFAAYDGVVRPIWSTVKVFTAPFWGPFAIKGYHDKKKKAVAEKTRVVNEWKANADATDVADETFRKNTGLDVHRSHFDGIGQGVARVRARAEILAGKFEEFTPTKRQEMLDAADKHFGADYFNVFGGKDPAANLPTSQYPSAHEWTKIIAFDEMLRYLDVGVDSNGRLVMSGRGVKGAQARAIWLKSEPTLNGNAIGYRDELQHLGFNERAAYKHEYGVTFGAKEVQEQKDDLKAVADELTLDPKYIFVAAATEPTLEMEL